MARLISSSLSPIWRSGERLMAAPEYPRRSSLRSARNRLRAYVWEREREREEREEEWKRKKGRKIIKRWVFNTWKGILSRGLWRPLASTSPVNSWCKSTTDIICQSICTDWFFYCLRLSKRPPRPDTLRNANSHRSNTFSTWLKFLEWENHYPDASACACRELDSIDSSSTPFCTLCALRRRLLQPLRIPLEEEEEQEEEEVSWKRISLIVDIVRNWKTESWKYVCTFLNFKCLFK